MQKRLLATTSLVLFSKRVGNAHHYGIKEKTTTNNSFYARMLKERDLLPTSTLRVRSGLLNLAIECFCIGTYLDTKSPTVRQ